MTDDNYQKFLLDNKLIDIHDFARKIYEYEAGVTWWTDPFFPDQIKEMYIAKAIKLLEWLNDNGEAFKESSKYQCQCGCDCINANCKCH